MTRRPAPAVDETTRRAVAAASSPLASAWVSANAGSGKTFVLARRVVRLLLAGTDPGRILCLTFTKAAAAEMANRVFATLAEWATLSDTALREEITDIGELSPDAHGLAAARRLFARALETPGGLKIQTIHAFCERLLHQFPFEANVAGHFDVLEERDAAALMVDARRRVLARAARRPEGSLGDALTVVLSHASDMTYEEALAEFVERRDRVRAWLAATGSIDRSLARLRAGLGLGETDSVAGLRRTILTGSAFDLAAARRLLALLTESDRATDRKAAARLAPYFEGSSEDARIRAWLDFLTTATRDLRQPGGLVTASIKSQWPELDALLDAETARMRLLLDRIKAAECFDTTAAMFRLAGATIEEYERLKAVRGALDFDDLIVRTADLLSRSDAARWVQYKLDRGLDHILVDEAQDTNPRQWQVILRLAEDFFAGAGASEATRTLFAVGDEKQSIFSFQGAVPDWFSRVKRDIGRKARAAGHGFDDVALHLSFRSTQVVLSAVDTVFAAARARQGVTSDEDWPYHAAARNDPGRVVVWPLIEPPEQAEPQDWATPLDHLDARSPEVVLAERIARTIEEWLATGETIEATGAPIRPGGILILTRTRGAQTAAINRALKTRGVPIAGADRLRLTEHIAVMDLMALARVVLLPDDDLSLAVVLRSPLIGLSEEGLFRLAHGRAGLLWEALAGAAEADACAARVRLEAWRAEADWRDPHAFFAHILGPEGGRLAFMRRLGAEAEDVLDEFLAQALAYERTNTPSLQGFLAWLESATTEITRDSEMLRDEVRVMTVHGAKGLEADIVFLVDTGSAPVHASHDPRVIALGDAADDTAPLVWMRSRRAMPDVVKERLDALRLRDAEEYRRLLYVAMTRARDRLYVCGTKKQSTDPAGGWHALVTNALEAECRRVEADGDLVALEWRADAVGAAKKRQEKQYLMDLAEIPAWALRAAPPVAAAAAQQLAPSTALSRSEDPEFAAASSSGDAPGEPAGALLRGRLIHRLLQSLPDHPPDRRRAVGAAYLEAIAPEVDAAAMLDEVMALLDDRRFAPLFAADSRAEVDIAGRVALPGGTAEVSGRIDRLAVTDGQVFIVDYKTNRPAPCRLADVPEAYVVQLSLYRHVLARLYPDRPVTAALLWTDVPLLMEIPSRLLDEAISRLTATETATRDGPTRNRLPAARLDARGGGS